MHESADKKNLLPEGARTLGTEAPNRHNGTEANVQVQFCQPVLTPAVRQRFSLRLPTLTSGSTLHLGQQREAALVGA